MPQAEDRWMPPSPHREAIEADLAAGRAHILERGHGNPPLLVFEDGGMIELPCVRLEETRRGLQLVASEGPATRGETRFGDVCGSVDEILGCVRDTGDDVDPAYLTALAEDIRYMLGRMARRSRQYIEFFESVRALAETALAEERPDIGSADARVDALRTALEAATTAGALAVDEITARAEHARALAQGLEDSIARQRDAAIRIGERLAEVRGGRNWASPAVPPAEE